MYSQPGDTSVQNTWSSPTFQHRNIIKHNPFRHTYLQQKQRTNHAWYNACMKICGSQGPFEPRRDSCKLNSVIKNLRPRTHFTNHMRFRDQKYITPRTLQKQFQPSVWPICSRKSRKNNDDQHDQERGNNHTHTQT